MRLQWVKPYENIVFKILVTSNPTKTATTTKNRRKTKKRFSSTIEIIVIYVHTNCSSSASSFVILLSGYFEWRQLFKNFLLTTQIWYASLKKNHKKNNSVYMLINNDDLIWNLNISLLTSKCRRLLYNQFKKIKKKKYINLMRRKIAKLPYSNNTEHKYKKHAFVSHFRHPGHDSITY